MVTLYNHEFEDISEHRGLSIEDSDAVEQVSNSISLEHGHFVVDLPWEQNKSGFPNHISVAQRSLMQLQKRFVLDSDLCTKYKNLIHVLPKSGIYHITQSSMLRCQKN